jgi:AraC family transcriptional regulator
LVQIENKTKENDTEKILALTLKLPLFVLQFEQNKFMLRSINKSASKHIIRGGSEMNYRIIEKESFNLVGFKKRVPIIFKGVNPEIEKMTELLTPEVVKQLKSISNVEPKGIISASTNFSEGRMEEKGELDHYIGVATTSNETAEYDILNIDAGTWAIFESIGPFPETLQNIWGRIYSEWFPSSGYEAVEGPEILWNESPDTSNPKYRSEIWIPVKKKDN